MEKINKFIVGLLKIVASTLFFIMTFTVFFQVLCRYAIHMPLAWSDELARLLLIWTSFIGVTLVYFSDAGHPAVTYFMEKMPKKFQSSVKWILNVILFVCFIVVGYAGVRYSIRTHRFFSPVLRYHNSLKYCIAPICFYLMAFKSLQGILKPIFGKGKKEE